MRRLLMVLLVLAFVTGAGFIVAILRNDGSGVELHEVGGLVLLVLLLLSLAAALRLRSFGRRLRLRVVVALAALIAAGATGASLAGGVLTGALAGLPLLPLIVMLAAIADGIRVTWEVPATPMQ
ncbi:MAG: hypothetical protein WCB18_08525 [Thermoplasmata archaeon]